MNEMKHAQLLAVISVQTEVTAERQEQHSKWGEQDHDNGTGFTGAFEAAESVKHKVDRHARTGTLTWTDILAEEVAEAFAEKDPKKIRAELVQVAAVAIAWIECIDRKDTK